MQRPTSAVRASGATHSEGERAAARPNTSLYCKRAYRLMSPPMELPPMKVCARSGWVR